MIELELIEPLLFLRQADGAAEAFGGRHRAALSPLAIGFLLGYGRRVGATLGTRLSQRDKVRFVGRARELALLDGLFVDDPPASVVLVHGPGGIGKSTLLRAVARRAEERGWTPVFIEGRDLPPVADAVATALAAPTTPSARWCCSTRGSA